MRRWAWLTIEVVKMAAKLTASNRRARPSRDLSTPLASLMSHMRKSSYPSALMITRASSKADRRTGLLSQSSPNSSILAKRSSTIGLINSSARRICDGRLDIARATILTPIQRYKLLTRGGNVRLERFREHSEDYRKFCSIDHEVQI